MNAKPYVCEECSHVLLEPIPLVNDERVCTECVETMEVARAVWDELHEGDGSTS